MLIGTGPAGSGKTTTVYALLQYIAPAVRVKRMSIIAYGRSRLSANWTALHKLKFRRSASSRTSCALRSILRQDH